MNIATIIISILAIIISVIAIIPHWKAYNKTKFKVHLTCEKYEENDKMFCNLMCINFSLEPYSILRLDYILGDQIQFIGSDELLKKLPTTLIPPRGLIVFKGIEIAFTKEEILRVDNDSKLLNCIKVYTTERYDPYCIHLRNGLDDSIIKLVQKS